MSNYPDYTWEHDPMAPWNEPWDCPEDDCDYDDPRTDMLREEGMDDDW